MSDSLECVFGTICGDESKWYLVLIIGGIIICGIEGAHVSLDLIIFSPLYQSNQDIGVSHHH